MLSLLVLLPLFALTKAVPQTTSSSNCVGTISSLSDVSAAVQCTTVNINSFTVPAGKTFSLELLQGTTVNVLGEIQFGNISWAGPLFSIKGQDIQFNGNGQLWDGGGSFYWDGYGTNGGITKPRPMMSIQISGTLSNVHVVNSPAHAFSIDNPGSLVIDGVNIDDSQGNYPNAKSDDRPAGHNTDGFDVCGDDVVIRNCVVVNQDDCLAIKRGKNIVFENNYCQDGHGISIGSISSDTVVEGVVIQGNTVVDSAQGFRIKTDRGATNSRVSNVTYSGNTAKNCTSFGVLVTQSYPSPLGDPGSGVVISDISFSPSTTKISVTDDGESIALNCGEGCCSGHWDWSGLETDGGQMVHIKNVPAIAGIAV